MLAYITQHKGKLSHILVYTLDRFSRSGGAAIKIAADLRNEFGVSVLAVTQPTDNTNPSGIFQQNIQLLFSEFDNQLRRQRAMAGMKEKFERGIWCIRPPFGYSIVREDGRKKIIINAKGELLRQAFDWKASGMRNQAILEKLNLLGLDLYKQKLSQILKNPFYAGIISTKMLDGRLVEGEHEKLISPELFLRIHQPKRNVKSSYQFPKKSPADGLPLKVFVRCAICKEPLTGYSVQKKDHHLQYYKCRTKGCHCNNNAEKLHHLFTQFLCQYQIKPEYLSVLQECLERNYKKLLSENANNKKALIRQLEGEKEKALHLQEQYYNSNKMDEPTYTKLAQKNSAKQESLQTAIAQCDLLIDSTDKIQILSLAKLWEKGPDIIRHRLQQLIFPDGIDYHHQHKRFQTISIDPVFSYAA